MLSTYRMFRGGRIRLAPLFPLAAMLFLGVAQAQNGDGRTFLEKPMVAPSVTQVAESAKVAMPTLSQTLMGRGPTPSWIWGADASKSYVLRKEFPGGATAAGLWATADNRMTVFLNGRKIGEGVTWQEPITLDVLGDLKPEANVLEVVVQNDGDNAGFACKLAMSLPQGKSRYVVSDRSWRASANREAKTSEPVRTIGRMGDAPWGDLFSKAQGASSVPRGVFHTLPGYQVEHLFSVPRDTLGSWVSITMDPKGRLLASDQDGKGIVRITPSPIGSDAPTKVERLNLKITAAQGMLCAFDSLYLSVNGGPGSGLYRARDTNGDDQYDEVVKLAGILGSGEHGPHALRLSPDGKSIYLVCGNHTDPPSKIDSSLVPRNWNEDHLLPRQWDANGHARGRMAPGGWIAKTDPEGKTWEIVSVGYRNSYDFAFNTEGEIFAYDSDMEWDYGMPWYRPTRVTHSVSGSEFGWRSGTGKWPAYYVDSLPAAVDIGPGSPVGVTFGHGAKFPAKYQKALFILDWTFGTIYAIHLQPNGSTYSGVKEEFLSRTPLPLTDVAVGSDGALYFTSGGRGTQSDLFRVRYVGDESTAPADLAEPQAAELRAYRRKIETYHRKAEDPKAAVAEIWPALKHPDRFIRYAARVGLEHQDVAAWRDRVFAETNAETLITSSVALARQGDKSIQKQLLDALGRVDYGTLTESEKLEILRAYQLVFIRMGEPDAKVGAALAQRLDSYYPAKTDEQNRELCNLLVYLKSPNVAGKTIAMMKVESRKQAEVSPELLARNAGYGGTIAMMLANRPDAQNIAYAFSLRNLKTGWTLAERQAYFQFLQKARSWSGGASYPGFINNIDRDAFENASDAERLSVEATGARTPYRAVKLPSPEGPGREWTLDQLVELSKTKMSGRNFEHGKRTYAAARCVACHRFGGDGGATGPDLTQAAGRFGFKDIAEATIDPSKVVSDQYKASSVATKSGKVYSGRVVGESKTTLTLLVDPEDSTKVVEIPRVDIEEMKPVDVSLMPKGLLNTLNENEVLDLMAYILSRGDEKDPIFRRR